MTPAFAPVRQPRARGLNGAVHCLTRSVLRRGCTTPDLDHTPDVADLVLKGRDLEKVVLARAVRHHLEDRVLAYDNKTVVF